MPELPEVETVRRGLDSYIVGHVIQEITIRNPHLRWQVAEDLPLRAQGQVIKATSRRGKYMIWHLQRGDLIWHLGMSGVMRIREHTIDAEKHDHIDVIFNQHRVRFTDPRRFGSLFYSDNWQEHPLLQNLGPEPLSTEFNAQDFAKALYKSQRNIKAVLMDSHVVVGVGNIYASEALFLAKINPETPAANMTFAQIEKLVDAVKFVLNKAIQAGGTTLKDFLQINGKPGYFRHELQVYAKALQPCPICQTLIQKIVLGQRATYFCPECQKI